MICVGIINWALRNVFDADLMPCISKYVTISKFNVQQKKHMEKRTRFFGDSSWVCVPGNYCYHYNPIDDGLDDT